MQRENTFCSFDKMQYGLNCSTLRKFIYEQIEKKEGEKKRKRGLHQNEVNLLCLALALDGYVKKKVELSLTHLN